MVRPRILPRDPVVAPPRGVSRELGGVGGDAIRGLELGDRLGLLLTRVVRHLPQTTGLLRPTARLSQRVALTCRLRSSSVFLTSTILASGKPYNLAVPWLCYRVGILTRPLYISQGTRNLEWATRLSNLFYICLDTYMLCRVYQERGICLRNHCRAEPPRDIEPPGLVATVGGRDRASTSHVSADGVKAPASAARCRVRGVQGGRTAPSLPADP
jgi:hypothetical protein